MKKYALVLLFIFLFPALCFGAYRYNSNTRTRDYCIEVKTESGNVVNSQCEDIKVDDGTLVKGEGFFLLKTGAVYGTYTSMTSSDTAIDISYSYVMKTISSDPAFQTGTLPNGVPGKLLIIEITTKDSDDATWKLTPTKATGFISLIFEATGDRVALLYLDDATGWIIVEQGSVQTIGGVL